MPDIIRTALVAAAVIVALSGDLSGAAMASTGTPATAETTRPYSYVSSDPVVVVVPAGSPSSNPADWPQNGYACRGKNSGTSGVNRTWCNLYVEAVTFEKDEFTGKDYTAESYKVRFTITPSPNYPTIDYTSLYYLDAKGVRGFTGTPIVFIDALCSSGTERCGQDILDLPAKSTSGQVRLPVPSMRGHALAIAIQLYIRTTPLFGSDPVDPAGRIAWASCNKSSSLCRYP
jgi:hypothetical protein